MRSLEQSDGGFGVRGADRAPSGARGDGGNEPPFVRIRIEQQERAFGFFAHFSAFRASA
jgi:hypothetical protein